jgi:hypothetical protein
MPLAGVRAAIAILRRWLKIVIVGALVLLSVFPIDPIARSTRIDLSLYAVHTFFVHTLNPTRFSSSVSRLSISPCSMTFDRLLATAARALNRAVSTVPSMPALASSLNIALMSSWLLIGIDVHEPTTSGRILLTLPPLADRAARSSIVLGSSS